MKEIIAWKKQGYWDREVRYGSEWSLDNGIFGNAHASLTYRVEEPAVYVGEEIPLKDVRIATDEQRERYIAAVKQLDEAKFGLKLVEKDIAENGSPMTWDWILAHGKPSEKGYVPIPFKHKKELANLRKGSRVVLAVVSSNYCKIQSQVGKVVKKRSKDVVVAFRSGTYRIPYTDLKPAHEVSAEQRKKNEKEAEMLGKVATEFNKVVGSL